MQRLFATNDSVKVEVPPEAYDCAICHDARVLKVDGNIVRCGGCWTPPTKEQLMRGTEGMRPMTFENFATSTQTQAALDACKELVNGKRWCVFLRGKYGIGKTHLAVACMAERADHGQGSVFANAPDYLSALKETFDNDGKQRYEARFQAYAECPFLVLDDLGAEYMTEWARGEIYRLVDRRYRSKLPLLVTSNQPDKDIDPRILSRLSPGRIVIQGVPDRRKEFER